MTIDCFIKRYNENLDFRYGETIIFVYYDKYFNSMFDLLMIKK